MADDLCSPLIAAGSQADLGIQEEVCYADLPTVPNLRVFPRVSTTLTLTKEAYTSETIRRDRMTVDSRHGIRSASGDISVELAPEVHEMAYEALMGGVWSAPEAVALTVAEEISIAQGSAAGTVLLTLAAGTWFGIGFRFGDGVTFIGTGDADLDNRTFTIVSLSGDEAVAIPYIGWPTAKATTAPTTGSFGLKGARCTMGNIYRSFLMERAFTDIGSFIKFRGLRFNALSVELPPTGIATATFGVMGKDADPIAPASFDGVSEIVLDETDLTSLTFDAAAGTITAAAGDFVAAGVTVGSVVLIQGAGLDAMPQNRNPRTVIGVTATVLTVAEAIQSGVTAAGGFTVTRVGLPDYTAAAELEVLVAVSGVLLIDGEPVGTITAASLSVDNGMAGSNVVGANTMPIILWGNRASVTGSLTVLFDRGGAGEKLYNAFDLETDVSLVLRMDSASGEDFLSFVVPRVKINEGSIGDAVAEGLPVTTNFVGLVPIGAMAAQAPASMIYIQDSKVTPVA